MGSLQVPILPQKTEDELLDKSNFFNSSPESDEFVSEKRIPEKKENLHRSPPGLYIVFSSPAVLMRAIQIGFLSRQNLVGG